MNCTTFLATYPAIAGLLKEYVEVKTNFQLSEDLSSVKLTFDVTVKLPEFVQDLLR